MAFGLYLFLLFVVQKTCTTLKACCRIMKLNCKFSEFELHKKEKKTEMQGIKIFPYISLPLYLLMAFIHIKSVIHGKCSLYA